jgi:hypothetical protein
VLDLPIPLWEDAPVNFDGQQWTSFYAGWYYFTSAADWCLRLF